MSFYDKDMGCGSSGWSPDTNWAYPVSSQPEPSSMASGRNKNVNGGRTRKENGWVNTAANADCNKLLDTNEHLEKQCKKLQKENETLWKQSAEVFKRNRRRQLENVSDSFPTITVVDQFRHLYADDWCSVWEEGEDDCSTIDNLSVLLEEVNRRCITRAEQQIRSILCLDEEDKLPTRLERPDLYRFRRNENIDDATRQRVITKIVDSFMSDENKQCTQDASDRSTDFDELFRRLYSKDSEEKYSEYKECVCTFFRKFADLCWLLAIAEENIIIDFDVKGKHYEEVQKRFSKYSSCTVITDSKPVDTVKTLVWPCVRKVDGIVLEKGVVMVVERTITDF